ncbi:divalent metal cation transporter [Fulvivirga sp. M361]|uniref:NRAMP family divalent metal transporter n=1 Tax=Fulvivirga sp. M361 TaxID=2594266 RepID=UPI00117B068C|nr:divalent metal cation transporter [Fulvivirga sp. M361]TRX61349.1 divalent metal cation transporter [Fulvivirga sp. M361]
MSSLRKRLVSILFWSVISAAFIGPGTLATASSSGTNFQLQLVWVLIFATLACIVLQEMAARLTIMSKKDLITILSEAPSSWPVYAIGLSVVLGCAAYEAGNILGAIGGLQLVIDLKGPWLTLLVGVFAASILWYGNIAFVAKILGVLVAFMGVLFLAVASNVDFQSTELLKGTFIPSIPTGAEWLVLGLIGTTIVPYNLFLGSGLGHGKSLNDMRFGLILSVILGGMISIAILIAGTQITQFLSFTDLAVLLGDQLGSWAYGFLGLGLFAAGLTSCITAPLAAALIFKVFFKGKHYSSKNNYYRLGWGIVLLTGIAFGLSEVKPLPIILAAQALNGLILPIVGILLIVKTNDPTLVKRHTNTLALNILSFIILEILLLIGFNNLWKALESMLGFTLMETTAFKILLLQLLALPFLIYTLKTVLQKRHAG